MIRNLEKRIEERKQQARDRNIIGKAQAVAEKLGTFVQLENDDAREEGHRYENESLKVTRLEINAFPTHGFSGRNFVSTSVKYGGEERFYAENEEIKMYIPGNWERELNKLYKDFPAQTEKVAEDYSQMELREKAAKFGL